MDPLNNEWLATILIEYLYNSDARIDVLRELARHTVIPHNFNIEGSYKSAIYNNLYFKVESEGPTSYVDGNVYKMFNFDLYLVDIIDEEPLIYEYSIVNMTQMRLFVIKDAPLQDIKKDIKEIRALIHSKDVARLSGDDMACISTAKQLVKTIEDMLDEIGSNEDQVELAKCYSHMINYHKKKVEGIRAQHKIYKSPRMYLELLEDKSKIKRSFN